MSNIETRPIDRPGIPADLLLTSLRSLYAVAALLVVWVSFQPYSGGVDIEEGGNVLNQLGYTGLVGLAFLMLIVAIPSKRMIAAVAPGWMVMIGLVFLSAVMGPLGGEAIRGVMFALFAFCVAAFVVPVVPDSARFSLALSVGAATVLAMSYAGLVLKPDAAIHQSFELESTHSGLWRGIYSHKNIAGPVFASLAFSGIYLFRKGRIFVGSMITLAAMVFVLQTGSKTSTALVPLVAMIVLLPAMMGLRWLSPLAAVVAFFGIQSLTVGTVFVPFLDDILRIFAPDTSFTGRTEIWRFARDYVYQSPWTGYGFGGFWKSAMVENAERAFDATWDPRGIIHGHNGYLDVILIMGLPGLILMIWLTVIAPALDYLRTPRLRENALMADLFYMIVIFATFNSALESFFFQRSDPVWLTLVFALFGLRLVSRVRYN